MGENTGAGEPQAQYIAVQDVAYEPAKGCLKTFRKPLLTTESLQIEQVSVQGRGKAEHHRTGSTEWTAYVLSGSATLDNESRDELKRGHLVVIPAGVPWGEQLSLTSDELVLLEIARSDGVASPDTSDLSAGEAIKPAMRVVDPKQVKPYAPAGHAGTQNRCLYVDGHMEIIEGLIERGGGAERHFHRDHEQWLYVLGGLGVPLLIHYPKGAPHGTGGGIAEALELLVIYSPPLGESHNALG